ncbi:acyl carrier protein [Streptomyces sp. CBMA123]|uniref:acyl carrier protein n=1 Tax=Streptomyces sp. CBMA123 TaxID=1896313 RepID=UPI001661D1CE|nr:acyl carrier protein [Streptomyces sp. CBMA123]MBD0694989.1 actinorhodin polyketide synthase [Streptomyces sp. CBMA123]
MAELDIDDIRRILVACAGAQDGIDLSGDILDTSFSDLGYDSLALMESAARIEREYGIELPEDRIGDVGTPRDLIALAHAAPAAVR